MEPRKRAIATLNDRINGQAEENRGRLAALGEYLAAIGPKQFTGTELEEGYRRVRQLRKELPEQRLQARSIVQLVERHRAKQTKVTECRRRIADLNKQNEAVCEQIGRVAYTAYRNIPSGQEEFGSFFSRLEVLDSELQQGRSMIANLESRTKRGPFVARAGMRGRITYLKGALALKNRTMESSFKRTGKEICESELMGRIKDEHFAKAIKPFMENKKQIQTLKEQKEQLRAQQEEIWAELKKLGAEKNQEKKVRELEKVIAETERRLKEGCLSLGLQYRKKPVPGLAGNEEITALLEEISNAEKAMAADRKQIRRLEADLQAEEISRELEKMREKIESLSEEIDGRRQDLAALEQSLRDREAERNRLMKRRGAESTLLEIEAPKKKGKAKNETTAG